MIPIYWIVIAIFIVIGIITIKVDHLNHRLFVLFLILLALVLYSSMVFVINQNNLDLSNKEGIFNGIKVYTVWLINSYQNIKTLTGKAINMDWKTTMNETNKTNNKLK